MGQPHTKVLPSSKVFTSDITALVAGDKTITLDLDHDYRHWFCAVEYYDAATGLVTDVVSPTAGVETYMVLTPVQPVTYQGFTDNAPNAADEEQVNWGSPTNTVQVAIVGATGNGATHFRLRAIGVIS